MVSRLTDVTDSGLIATRVVSVIAERLINPLDSKFNYKLSATSNNTKSVHWPLMGGLLHLVQRGGARTGWGPTQSPSRCTKCNSPPISDQSTNFILYYNCQWP